MGKHKKKQRQHQAERRRQQKRGQRNARKQERKGPAPMTVESGVRLPPLDPPEPRRCFPAVHVDGAGKVIADPYAVLGVPVGADAEAIGAAWRAGILERPPERDPEGARRLLEARERLLDPRRVIERELGVLHVPEPGAFGLPAPAATPERLPAEDRLVGQLVLYALLEAMETGEGQPGLVEA